VCLVEIVRRVNYLPIAAANLAAFGAQINAYVPRRRSRWCSAISDSGDVLLARIAKGWTGRRRASVVLPGMVGPQVRRLAGRSNSGIRSCWVVLAATQCRSKRCFLLTSLRRRLGHGGAELTFRRVLRRSWTVHLHQTLAV